MIFIEYITQFINIMVSKFIYFFLIDCQNLLDDYGGIN